MTYKCGNNIDKKYKNCINAINIVVYGGGISNIQKYYVHY
jgi:hypothetical protein